MERGEHANRPFWTPSFHPAASGTLDAAAIAVEHLQQHRQGRRADRHRAGASCRSDALAAARPSGWRARASSTRPGCCERLRAIKTPAELGKLREASELITDSMLATIGWAREGTTKAEIIERLRREETGRGLHFEYCLLTLGAEPQPRRLRRRPGSPARCSRSIRAATSRATSAISARMGVLGEPDAELQDLLAEVDAVQQAAFAKVRAGALGGDVIAARRGGAAGGAERRLHRLLRPRHGADHATRCRS